MLRPASLAAIGVASLMLIVFLWFMSSRTGNETFDAQKRQLENIEALNVQLDGALFQSMFELQMDFDLLTDLHGRLRAAVELYASELPGRGSEIGSEVRRKLDLVEDFKSAQAVLRNSRKIAAQVFEQLGSRMDAMPGEDREQLFALERAYLDFVGRRDPISEQRLRSELEAARSGTSFEALDEWSVLEAHLLSLMGYVASMGILMQQMFLVPLQEAFLAENARITERLAGTAQTASRYRVTLFAVAALLLAFSASLVARLRKYFRMIERANDELEERVVKRTEELGRVNAALVDEIAERESVESQLRLAQKLEAIGQLAAGVAHEINTPAQYVSDNLAFLGAAWRDLAPLLDDYERCTRGGVFDPCVAVPAWEAAAAEFLRAEVPAALRQATEGLAQITKIVLAINNFSHPGGGGLQPVDLNKAIENITIVTRNEWKYVAELTLDLDPTLEAVPCDVSAFGQVMLNLIVNAAQAIADVRRGEQLGHIRVATRRLPEWAEISVEDDGPGVPPAIRDRIFDLFFTTKEIGKGTGQGLAIAHRVIHGQHRGTLTLVDVPGGGARFVVRMPLSTPAITAGAIERPSLEAQPA